MKIIVWSEIIITDWFLKREINNGLLQMCCVLHYILCIKFKPQCKGSRPFESESQTKYGNATPLWIDRELRSAGSSHSILFLIIIITYNEKKSVRGRSAIWDVCCRHSPIRFRGEFSAFSKITWLFANSRPVVIWEKQQKPSITIGCAQPPGIKLIKQSVLLKKNKYRKWCWKRRTHFTRWIPSASCWRASHPSGCWGPWPPYLWPPRQTAYRRNWTPTAGWQHAEGEIYDCEFFSVLRLQHGLLVLSDCELESPAGQRWRPGCWSAEWSLWPWGLSHMGCCPRSSSAGSPLGSWCCWHTVWTCQTCSLSLGGGNQVEKPKRCLEIMTCDYTHTIHQVEQEAYLQPPVQWRDKPISSEMKMIETRDGQIRHEEIQRHIPESVS